MSEDPQHTSSVPVSVVIPAWRRNESLMTTLTRVKACRPAPAEILVHVDGSAPEIMDALQQHHPDVRVLGSSHLIGPGGARDVLIRAASQQLVATFDDDSYPESTDFLARVVATFERLPDMAVLAANVLPETSPPPKGYERIGEFIGCGCVFAKAWYLKTTGFVPRPVAYGMEEADISLQLHALGGKIIRDANLRVVHDRESPDRFGGEFHEEVVINCVMLPFLRYPWPLLPLVAWHLASRLTWEIRTGWGVAAIAGLLRSSSVVWAHRGFRKQVPMRSVLSWFKLKRYPVPFQTGSPESSPSALS